MNGAADRRDFSFRFVLGAVLTFVLLLPLVSIFFHVSALRLPPVDDIASVFLFTLLQAALSALASLIFGVLGGFGLLALSLRGNRAGRVGEALTLLPNAAPVIVILLATMKVLPSLRGLTGIIFVHSLLNIGLVAVSFTQLARTKIAALAELAWVEGASGWKFFWRGAFPILRTDLLLLFLFVFALCFSSFAVPLMIGGSRATTIEVLIYQKVRLSSDWSEALGLATLQLLPVMILSWLLTKRQSAPIGFRVSRTPLLSWSPGLIFCLAPVALLFWGLIDGVDRGLNQLRALGSFLDELPILILGSAFVSVGSGLLTLMLLLVIAFISPAGKYRKALLGYAAPSSVLTGFGLLIFWRELGGATYLKIILGLALISLPAFYRLRWDSALRALDGQVVVARTLGASRLMIFSRILFPQLIRPATWIGGLAALWAWGDFALSSVIAERAVTLPLAIRTLMETYRFDAATVLIWLVLGGGLITFALFLGAGYVLGPKSKT